MTCCLKQQVIPLTPFFCSIDPKTPITVQPSVSEPTLTLSADPTAITAGDSSTLTWKSTDATSCTASGSWSGTKALSGSETVSPTASASYALVCANSAGSVTKSVSVTVSPVPSDDVAPPSTPTNLTVQRTSSTSVALTWTASTDETGVAGYKVYRCSTKNCTLTDQVGTTETASYADANLAKKAAYTYRVKAYDAAGNDSDFSTSVKVATPAK